MSEFHHHPDGLIYIRTGSGTYADTPENFALDNGSAEPALEAGAVERVYEPGVRHALMANGNVVAGGPMPWAFGDAAIAAIGSLLSAQATRNEVPAPPAAPPNVQNVQAERGRRLAHGFNYTFPAGDARGTVRIGTTEADMAGWDEVTKYASALLATGDTTTAINIVTDSGPIAVSPAEWQAILVAAGQFRQPIWGASFTLQSQNPIPADYADDSHWPAVQ